MEVLNQVRRKQMYLKRKIYDRLVQWKDNADHSTLEVNGARQVGKTYLINKFADENFTHKIYVNLFELSGKQFLDCYKQATQWQPGQKRPEHPLHDAFHLYEQMIQLLSLTRFRSQRRFITGSESLQDSSGVTLL